MEYDVSIILDESLKRREFVDLGVCVGVCVCVCVMVILDL